MPLTTVTSVLSLILIAFFFISGADAASVVMAMIASRGNLHPAKLVVATMGCVMGAIACALLLVGGLSALQQGAVLASVPFTFVIVGLGWSLTKALREERQPAHVPLACCPTARIADEGRVMRRAVVLLLALAIGACGDDEANKGGSAQPQGAKLRITLGTQDFPEARLLGELWRQALAVNGYTVDLRKRIGPTEDLDRAVRAGEIDGHPAYTGTSLSIVFGEEVSGLDAERTYDQVKALYENRGQAISAMTPFENVDAIATTSLFAQRERLRTIADLRRLDSFTLGARPEFENLYLGLEGLQQLYSLTNATFVPVTLGAQYAALDEGDVEAANVFTTDPQLQSDEYAVLEDPERLFGSQNAVMVVDADKLERIGAERFMRVVDEVNSRLTNSAIVEMNQAVTEGQDDGEVAQRFLREAGLLRPIDSEQ